MFYLFCLKRRIWRCRLTHPNLTRGLSQTFHSSTCHLQRAFANLFLSRFILILLTDQIEVLALLFILLRAAVISTASFVFVPALVNAF